MKNKNARVPGRKNALSKLRLFASDAKMMVKSTKIRKKADWDYYENMEKDSSSGDGGCDDTSVNDGICGSGCG